jgi:hypothetical protein
LLRCCWEISALLPILLPFGDDPQQEEEDDEEEEETHTHTHVSCCSSDMAVASSRFVLLLLLSDNIPMIVNKARGKKEKETEKKI